MSINVVIDYNCDQWCCIRHVSSPPRNVNKGLQDARTIDMLTVALNVGRGGPGATMRVGYVPKRTTKEQPQQNIGNSTG